MSISETINDRKPHLFLLKPLPTQPRRDLIVTLFLVAVCGLRLRPELRHPNLSDAEAVRSALRGVEWRAER